MDSVPLGGSGLLVSPLGYGSMPLGGVYGPASEAESMALVRHVLDSGVSMIDTSSFYGDGDVERLIGRTVRGRRDEVQLATKFGMRGPGFGRPEKVREALHDSLRLLQSDYIDIFYLHQIDPETPIEDTVGELGSLAAEGKITAVGLSEITPNTLRRAHATYPIAAVQQEYSLLARDIEAELLPTVRELGITLVAYSPLGRGLLTGRIRRPGDLPSDDPRRAAYPRFAGRDLARNLRAASRLFKLAEALDATPAELALGWVMAAHMVPIPGTRSIAHFDENIEAAVSQQDIAVTHRLSRMFPIGVASGDPYAPQYQQRLDEAP
ncbi:aldo/keto reductase [Microbacterium sp. NPDC056569]|uniref:aldo/keto reductase n=1 Tax=Microbacterium sp. NPDC056569 TaxID=3345867 RepID=UPI00366BF53C